MTDTPAAPKPKGPTKVSNSKSKGAATPKLAPGVVTTSSISNVSDQARKDRRHQYLTTIMGRGTVAMEDAIKLAADMDEFAETGRLP